MIRYLLFLLFLAYVSSLELKAVEPANIPLENITESVDQLSYTKFVKNNSIPVYLVFQFIGGKDVNSETLSLEINDITQKFDIDKYEKNTIFIKRVNKENNAEYTINFAKTKKIITGKYVFKIDYEGKVYSAESFINCKPVVESFPKARLGLEGDPMRLTCVYDAYPNNTDLVWMKLSSSLNDLSSTGSINFINATVVTENSRIEFTTSKNSINANDTLYIKKLDMMDIGLYACVVKRDDSEDRSIVKVTVKDRWAALYPFIGIVAEVLILVSAILAYERYQIRTQNKNKEAYDVNEEENREPAIPLTSNSQIAGDNPEESEGNDLGTPNVDVKSGNNDNIRQRSNQDV